MTRAHRMFLGAAIISGSMVGDATFGVICLAFCILNVMLFAYWPEDE